MAFLLLMLIQLLLSFGLHPFLGLIHVEDIWRATHTGKLAGGDSAPRQAVGALEAYLAMRPGGTSGASRNSRLPLGETVSQFIAARA
jgi:hypothetical protein